MKKIKLNDKGFTLLELIIVVAIMAVLVAVLAPQYFQYVEDAREGNDVYAANEMVKAVKLAAIRPQNDMPPNHFVELLWITGDESGSGVTKGSLMIRHNDKGRVSVFNDGEGDDDIPPTTGDIEQLRDFADSVFNVIAGEDAVFLDGRNTWLQVEFEDAQSKIANEANFAIHVNTSTGEVALARYVNAPNDADPNSWIELGLNAIPAPAK